MVEFPFSIKKKFFLISKLDFEFYLVHEMNFDN